MGYGNYSSDAHEQLLQGRSALSREDLFRQTTCHPLMNPKDVRVRESRDSAEHPNSIGIVFALDVTGSMGAIPESLAKQQLPHFMKLLTDCKIADPQLLFAAVGDATTDHASLQVGQFETTAVLMDQWLTWSFLEGGGGGQGTESYELMLYFLAEHTDMDCFAKRKRRGYILMTGDELPYPAVSRHQVDALIGDKLDEDIPTEEVVAAVRQTFHPFFLVPDRERAKNCEQRWRDLLGDYVVCMESHLDTCYVAAGLVALTEGAVPDLDVFAKSVSAAGAPRDRMGAIVRALTPYAELLGRAGVPGPDAVTSGGGRSFWRKLFG
jgi:hypothetical protein